MVLSLEGKRALVTGGSRGLGAAICKQLAAKGAKVAVNYAASEDRAKGTLDSLDGSGHVLIQGDAFDRASVKRIADEAIQKLGGVDIVISNAGWTQFAPFDDLRAVSDDDWMRCYQSNVMAHLWLMQDLEEELKKNQGCFIISASVAGLRPTGSSMAYSVSKAGCIHLAKDMAKACGPNIRVNAIAPGLILTEWAERFSPAQVEAWTNTTALKRVPTPEDIAATYIMLAENNSITGQILEVSSGSMLI